MPSDRDISAIMADGKLVEAALRKGVRAALLRHCQAGKPVVEWRDGKTVWVGPEELEKATKYYNRDIHRAVFAVPNYVKELLELSPRT